MDILRIYGNFIVYLRSLVLLRQVDYINFHKYLKQIFSFAYLFFFQKAYNLKKKLINLTKNI